MPVYSGTAIASYSVSGDALNTGTTTTQIKLNRTQDTIKYTFRVAPNDSVTVKNNIKLRYAAGDSIIVKNTDISGGFFNTSKVLTAPLLTSGNPFAATVKLPLVHSARLAVGINGKTATDGPSVYLVKRPLNFAVNPDWVRIVGKNSRMDGPNGVATSNTVTTTSAVLGTSVTHLEWSPSGKYIYFSTATTGTASAYYLYRVSHLEMVGDSMGDDYSGVFSSDIDSVSALRKSTGIRTTPIGKFSGPITSIAVSPNDTMVLVTLGGYGNPNTVYYSNSHAGKLNANSTDDTNFGLKNGTSLPVIPVYTGLLELNDNKRALIGTENGVYGTANITVANPIWVKEGGANFPNVPVFQLRQQTLDSLRSYNSGVIYAATHGRGIWTTDKYLSHYYIGIEENTKDLSFDSNMKLFPNPATNSTNIWFKAAGDANYKITVYDINGRTMMQYNAGKLLEGEHVIQMNTAELNSGIYFVTISGTNNFNANTKLVITH
jgi:hypothetical protein